MHRSPALTRRVRFLNSWRWHRGTFWILLTIHVALLAYSASIHSPVVDEPAHLASGVSHWQFADFALYRVNPPLVRLVATAPLLGTSIQTDWSRYSRDRRVRMEFSIGAYTVKANGPRFFTYVTLARWACIPFSLLGAIVCYRWARLLFGKTAGLAAGALWCFSPTVLANGSLITPDAAATSLGLASSYTLFRWLTAPSFRRCLLAGLVLGAAEAAKSTWIILFALYPLIWLLFRLALPVKVSPTDPRPPRNPRLNSCLIRVIHVIRGFYPLPSPRPQPRFIELAAILTLGWWLLLSIYAWQGVGAPLGSLVPRSNLFRALIGEPVNESEYRVRPALANVPLPLPLDYVIGLDRQCDDLDGPNRSFLRGEWRDEGWWHYYAYGLGVKETVGALVLAALSLAWWSVIAACPRLRARFSPRRRFLIATSALLALPPLAVLLMASMNTGMNHHVRYVMPVVPYLYILGAGLLVSAGAWRVPRLVAALSLTLAAVASSLLAFPHSHSYFNELVGGPAGGIHCLNNSNIDWGQDLLLLAKWKRRHLPGETLNLAYFGRVNPTYAGIDYRLPPIMPRGSTAKARRAAAAELKPGWYAASATLLQGRAYFVEQPSGDPVSSPENAFAYFDNLQPADRVGYSIYIYHVK